MADVVSKTVAALAVVAVLGLSNALAADFIRPWDNLTTDPVDGEPSWIGTGVTVYTVNAGTYRVGFDEAKPKNNYAAAGMNSITFSYGGSSAGHMIGGLSDNVTVVNGRDNTFTDLVLVIAINAPGLPAGFHCSVTGPEWTAPGDVPGTNSNARDLSDDFVWYDSADYATGRPSGYYATFTDDNVVVQGSNPDRDRFAWDFDNGMVTVFALRGLSMTPYGGSATIAYEFDNLPGKAVFSVYAKLSDLERVKHTNRTLVDQVDGAPVSTFEVRVPGDANGDGKVDGGDLAIWQQNYDPLGTGNNTFTMGDWNLDGKIDGGDLALWQQGYNPLGSLGTGGLGAQVPEPTTLLLLGTALVGGIGLLRLRGPDGIRARRR